MCLWSAVGQIIYAQGWRTSAHFEAKAQKLSEDRENANRGDHFELNSR